MSEGSFLTYLTVYCLATAGAMTVFIGSKMYATVGDSQHSRAYRFEKLLRQFALWLLIAPFFGLGAVASLNMRPPVHYPNGITIYHGTDPAVLHSAGRLWVFAILLAVGALVCAHIVSYARMGVFKGKINPEEPFIHSAVFD